MTTGGEQQPLPLHELERYIQIERALAAALPDYLDRKERQKLIKALLSSLDDYFQLGISLSITSGTQIQAATGLELLFTQSLANGEYLTPIRMAGVLTPTLTKRKKMMVKVNEHSQVLGFTWPQAGESFLDSYQRAELLRQAVLWYVDPALMGRRKHFDLEPVVAVVNDQQLHYWARLQHSPVLPPESYRPESVKLAELVTTLRAAMAHAGVNETHQLRITTLDNREVEVMLVDANGDYAPLDLLGLRQLNAGSRVTTEWVSDVIGIKCFADDDSETYRIETVRSLSHHFRTVATTSGRPPNFKILSMTPQLLQLWEQQLTAGELPIKPSQLPPPPETLAELRLRGLNEQLYPSQVKGARYLTFERSKPGIGAKPSWILVDYHDGTTEQICLDFGSQREEYYYNSLFDPSIRLGMAPFREILPSTAEIPKFYRLTLLLKSAEIAGAAFLQDIGQNADLIDLYLTLTRSDFRRLLLALDPDLEGTGTQTIMDELERVVQDDHQKQHLKHIAFLISHFHDDHVGFAALVGTHIPQVMSLESAPFRELFFNRGSWMDEVSIRRQRATLLSEKESVYYSPQQLLLQPYETRFLGRGKVSVTCLPCDHSIYGASMFLLTVYDDFGRPLHKILYTGDYRFRDTGLTEQSVAFLEAIGGTDTIITETTNVRPANGDSNKKSSTLLTKEQLHTNYDQLFATRPGQPILIQVDPKDLELIELITQHAVAHGRTVIYGIRHSEPIELFRQHDAANGMNDANGTHQQLTANMLAPQLPADHWLHGSPVRTLSYHPRPQFSQQTRILEPQKETLSKSERRIMQYHPDQMLAWQQLHAIRDAVIFIRPTNPLEEEMANVAPYLGAQDRLPRVSVVRAHYFTYQQRDRELAWRDRKFCQRMQWEYLTDLVFSGQGIHASQAPKYRMSGHPKPEDFFAFMETLLALNPQMRIIPVHGQARRFVGHELERRYGANVNVIKQMDKGRFELPLF